MLVKPSPIRALFVQSQTEIGGAETALLALTRNLNRVECQPVVALLGFGQGPLGERLRAQDVPVLDVPATRFRNILAAFRTIQTLARVIREQRINAVVANGGHPLLFARPAAMLAGIPCVRWVHNVLPADPLRDHLIGVVETLLGASRFVANSRKTAEALSRHFPAQPIDVIPPGIDSAGFAAAGSHRAEMRRALGCTEAAFVVGVFGRLQHNKGQHTVVQAAPKLLREKVPLRILVVGDTQFGLDRAYRSQLQQYVQRQELEKIVTFLGQREDVAELLAACDVAVQPAVVPESWGLTVAEAMAAGVPVVATRHGGPLEMIEDGATGMFYAPGDAGELAKVLLQLHRSPELRRRLGDAAQIVALREFSAARTATKFAQVLMSAVGANPISAHRPASGSVHLAVQLEIEKSEELESVSLRPPN